MKEDIKRRWLEALRSGEFMQGQRHLRSTDPIAKVDRFCCLGVLCEIAVQDGVLAYEEGTYFNPLRPDDGSDIQLPNAALLWAGLPSREPEVEIETETYGRMVLSSYNDSQQWTFGQIADLIEEML